MRRRAPVRVLRVLAKWVFWPALVLLTLNVEKLGEELGWDRLLVRHWSPTVSSGLDFLLSAWVQYPAVFLLGFAFGIWLDARLWRREPPQVVAEPSVGADPWPWRPSAWHHHSWFEEEGRASFDYSTNNGCIQVGGGDRLFLLRFTKASDTRIHLTKQSTNLEWIARVKGAPTGTALDMHRIERSSDNYTLDLADLFLAKNAAGNILQGRVDRIADDQRGAGKDEVGFAYRIMIDPPLCPETALVSVLV